MSIIAILHRKMHENLLQHNVRSMLQQPYRHHPQWLFGPCTVTRLAWERWIASSDWGAGIAGNILKCIIAVGLNKIWHWPTSFAGSLIIFSLFVDELWTRRARWQLVASLATKSPPDPHALRSWLLLGNFPTHGPKAWHLQQQQNKPPLRPGVGRLGPWAVYTAAVTCLRGASNFSIKGSRQHWWWYTGTGPKQKSNGRS